MAVQVAGLLCLWSRESLEAARLSKLLAALATTATTPEGANDQASASNDSHLELNHNDLRAAVRLPRTHMGRLAQQLTSCACHVVCVVRAVCLVCVVSLVVPDRRSRCWAWSTSSNSTGRMCRRCG